VAAAATSMASSGESRLFRFTLKHSVLLTCVIGLIVMFNAYLAPSLQPKDSSTNASANFLLTSEPLILIN